MSLLDNEIVKSFPSVLQPLIENLLLSSEKITRMNKKLTIRNLKSSRIVVDESCKVDRFSLILPLANNTIEWTVILNSADLALAPDFLFDDDSFLNDFDLGSIDEFFSSLRNWDINDCDALVKVITELYCLYKNHQINMLENHSNSQAKVEYIQILDSSIASADEIEVLIRGNEIDMVVFLDVDIPDHVCYSDFQKTPGSDLDSYISIVFHQTNRIEYALHLSARVEEFIGGITKGKVMELACKDRLSENVAGIKEFVNRQIKQTIANFEKRESFICTVVALYPQHVCEYDVLSFHEATLLLELDEFLATLKIDLPKNFPKDKPRVKLTAQGYYRFGKSFVEKIDNFVYNRSWKCELMIEEIFNSVGEILPTFKTNTINQCTESFLHVGCFDH